MPHANKLFEKYGDKGLHVLLVESQAHPREIVVPFMLQSFPGHGAVGVLGQDAPFQVPGNGLPKTALVGVDGTLVWVNDTGGGSLDKAIEAELEKLHQPVKLGRALQGVAKQLKTRAFGKAAAAARKVLEKAGEESDERSEADAVLAHLDRTVAARLAAAARVAAQGRPLKARSMLESLAKQVAGDGDWTARVAKEIAALGSAELEQDRAADKLVLEAEDLLSSRRGRDAGADKLGDVLKKYPDVKVAAYAKEMQAAALDKNALR